MTDESQNQSRHLIAMGAGAVAVAAFFLIPSGVFGYLAWIAIALIAVLIGHSAVRRRGPLLGGAIIGLVISYLVLITSAGMLLVRLLRIGTGA